MLSKIKKITGISISAIVRPLLKKSGLELQLSNYRPVSKTPVTPEWRPYSVPTAFKKIAERRGARCANASNAVQTLCKRCALA